MGAFVLHGMIKQSQKEAERPQATLSEDSETVIRLLTEPKHSYFQRRIQSITQDIDARVQRIVQFQADIAQLQLRFEGEKSALEKSLSESESTIAQTVERLKRMAYIETVRVSGSTLIVTTRLLFTQIRDNGDTKDTTRRCIGAFQVHIDSDVSYRGEPMYRVKVYNKLYKTIRLPHWSISQQYEPCWGDWREEVDTYGRTGDIVGFLHMLLPYLLSTNDGSAYMRAHQWEDMRHNVFTARRLRVGAHAILTQDALGAGLINDIDDDGDDYEREIDIPKGATVRILAQNGRGSFHVQLFSEHEGVTEFNVAASLLYPIKKAEFERGHIVDYPRTLVDMAPLDALPEHSTLSDAKKILGI